VPFGGFLPKQIPKPCLAAKNPAKAKYESLIFVHLQNIFRAYPQQTTLNGQNLQLPKY
jgi:hypothetical protein